MIRNKIKENSIKVDAALMKSHSYWKKDAGEIALYQSLLPILKKRMKGNILVVGSNKAIFEKHAPGNNIKHFLDGVTKIQSEKDGEFNTIVCIGALDHSSNPQMIIDEMERKLMKNGELIVVISFLMNIHDMSSFYYRSSANGLKYLFRNFNVVEIVNIGGLLSYIHSFISNIAAAILYESPALFGLWIRCNFVMGYFIFMCERILKFNTVPAWYIITSKKK